MTKIFSHCELDHFPGGCEGCPGDGKGDCAAVFIDAPAPVANSPTWSADLCWTSWLLGAAKVGAITVVHIGPLCIMRVWA